MATLRHINVNPAGGVPKHSVSAAHLSPAGVSGDRQLDYRHGGPLQAVCIFSQELIGALQQEGHPIEPGSTGENLTLEGLEWAQVVPGCRLQVGECLLEIQSFTKPCYKIADSFCDGDFKRMGQEQYPGWSRVYASVLQAGTVRVGDEVSLVMAPPSPA